MTDKKQQKKAEELNEQDLDQVQGGMGNFELQDLNASSTGGSSIKPRLTDAEKTGIRVNLTTDGTKLRK